MGASLDGFLREAGLDDAGAETLIRLAVCIIVDGQESALMSFSEPYEVDALARRVEKLIYRQEKD